MVANPRHQISPAAAASLAQRTAPLGAKNPAAAQEQQQQQQPSASIANLFSLEPPTVGRVVAGINEAQQAVVKVMPEDGRLSKLVAKDLFTLYLAVVLVCFIEDRQLGASDNSFFIRLFFEIISAFGTVGLSLPISATSTVCFSANLRPVSRMIVWIAMIFGKIRGLTPEMDFVMDFNQQVDQEAAAAAAAETAETLPLSPLADGAVNPSHLREGRRDDSGSGAAVVAPTVASAGRPPLRELAQVGPEHETSGSV
jgi:hypothetical protein